MCDRCREIDTQTEHYQKLAKLVIDRAAAHLRFFACECDGRERRQTSPSRARTCEPGREGKIVGWDALAVGLHANIPC
jgi:hypothetical protein